MRHSTRASLRVFHAIASGAWKGHPGRLALAVAGIAFGVALGVAVHLINASAAQEFDRAVRSLSGEADALVRGSRSGFPDTLYPALARLPAVQLASPALEIEVQLAGRRDTIKVLGLDPFRAAQVQPHLVGENRDAIAELLRGDAVLLSRAAADDLGLGAGDTLRMQSGTGVIAMRVIDTLPAGATRQHVAIMDIAAAQWRFGRVGELNRIDIRLRAGADLGRFRDAAAPLLPVGVLVLTPEAEAERSASLTRAYRTNLDMLALIALLTGAFLVFSTQFLALLRRRTQLALMRVLGTTRARLARMLIGEGIAVGVLGSALGLALGCVLAVAGIERLGGDLGAGYFRAVTPQLHIAPGPLLGYFALGIAFAVLGAALPALDAARRPPALALKAGDEESALHSLRRAWPGLALLGAGAVASQAPPIHGLPVFGYVSIGLMLLGAIVAMPRFTETVLARLPGVPYTPAELARLQLQATPREVAVSLAAIVASFSLMVSMVIMTSSFRVSLETWLDRMLPADLYVRAGRSGETGYFTPEEQQVIAQIPGVREAVFVRSQNVLLREDRPALSLIARPFADGRPTLELPLQGAEVRLPAGAPPPAWLSEVAAELLRAAPGDALMLPLGQEARTFVVAGIWRDYARQNGAIVIDRAIYTQLTGDTRANEAALHLEAGAGLDEISGRLRAALGAAEGLEIAATRELKRLSLSIFDRTFAVTYALELAAVVIGLFGVSASFSAQALARRREFGVLRHIGMTRGEIGAMLGVEGLAVGGLGIAVGLGLGWLVSLVLVHVVNRQSFHWSLDMHLPWSELAVLALLVVLAAGVTAVASGRRAMSDEVTRAVREDW